MGQNLTEHTNMFFYPFPYHGDQISGPLSSTKNSLTTLNFQLKWAVQYSQTLLCTLAWNWSQEEGGVKGE